ncbi:hypothetical protein CNR22_20910 [Sphingobacteriaceae bacterium]|nr:hypothetical protein CNR22_20910 [Sphingobacteriaceae bacterium]
MSFLCESLCSFVSQFHLTLVAKKTQLKSSFEPMKVPKNQQIKPKLINKIFVKKTTFVIPLSTYLELFLVLALNM